MKLSYLSILVPLLLPLSSAHAAENRDAAMSIKLYQVLTTAGAFASECNAHEGAEKAAYKSAIATVTDVTAKTVSEVRPEMTEADARDELGVLTKAINEKTKAAIEQDGCNSEFAQSMIDRYHELLKEDFSTLKSSS